MGHYLITGGCGFIGSHLAEHLLAAGHRVRVLDDLSTGRMANLPPGPEIVVADMCGPGAIESAVVGVDGVFHLAAVASVTRCNEAWLDSHRINQSATVALFDACRRAAKTPPVVYASSAAVYGDQPGLPLHEELAPAPLGAYGADKAACELHARAALVVHGLRSFGLRFFNVFGARQPLNDAYAGVITTFGHRARAGLPLIVNGDGLQTRDFVYVGDVVACLMRSMTLLRSESIPCALVANVATGQPTSILDLGHVIGELCGGTLAIEHRPQRVGEIRHSVGSVARLERLLGFRPGHTLRSGLAEML